MKKPLLFVIDDMNDVLEVMELQLHRIMECEVKCFSTHQELLDAINDGAEPDLILSDINMPDGHGEIWGNSLKEQGLTVPFLYYTGFDEDDVDGSDSVILSKPIEDHHLKLEIDKILK